MWEPDGCSKDSCHSTASKLQVSVLIRMQSNIARARTSAVCEFYIVSCAIAAVAWVLNAGFSTRSRTYHDDLLLNGATAPVGLLPHVTTCICFHNLSLKLKLKMTLGCSFFFLRLSRKTWSYPTMDEGTAITDRCHASYWGCPKVWCRFNKTVNICFLLVRRKHVYIHSYSWVVLVDYDSSTAALVDKALQSDS